MKPIADRIIIKAALDQKEKIVFGCLTLYVPFKSQYNSNEREGNPVLAQVVADNAKFADIKTGDVLLLNHTTIVNQATQMFREQQTVTMSVPCDRWILGKLGAKGELLPLFGNMVAERMQETAVSSIIVVPDSCKKTHPHRMLAIAVAPDIKHVREGATLLCYEYSDYEAVYNWNGEERRVIVVYEKDVLAVE